MIAKPSAALVGILALVFTTAGASCRRPPANPTANTHSSRSPLTTGVFHFTPRLELSGQGPVGVGSARCSLQVYAWENDGQCKVQLNHCSVEGNDESRIICMSLADERTARCGQQFDACGQTVQCDCPVGPAQPVAEAAGTVHLTPYQRDIVLRSDDGRCEARSGLPAWAQNAPPPPPCFFTIHEADPSTDGGIDRTEMVSAPGRVSICGRPIKCELPDAGN